MLKAGRREEGVGGERESSSVSRETEEKVDEVRPSRRGDRLSAGFLDRSEADFGFLQSRN